jgi:hypothetical protein
MGPGSLVATKRSGERRNALDIFSKRGQEEGTKPASSLSIIVIVLNFSW